TRPELAYPDVGFTGKYADPIALLLAQSVTAKAAEQEPALFDPDVTQLRIDVYVRTLVGDPAATSDTAQPFAPLYSAVRQFPPELARAVTLDFVFNDFTSVQLHPSGIIPEGAPLVLPTARDLRLVFTPMGAEDSQLDYWGNQESRIGAAPVN